MRFCASFSRSLFSFSRAFFWAVLNDLRGAAPVERGPNGLKTRRDAGLAPRRLPPHGPLLLVLLLPERVEDRLFSLFPESFVYFHFRLLIILFRGCRRYGLDTGRRVLPSAR
jgi:hypothetical protein